MGVRRSGFALVIVLLGVAGVFTLGLQHAAASRASLLEARVIRDRGAAEREARGAAVVALQGLFVAAERRREAGGPGSGGGAGDDAPDDEPEREELELPPMLRQVLGKKAEEIEKKAKEQQEQLGIPAKLAGAAGLSTTKRVSVFKVIEAAGLPPEPVEVRLGHQGERRYRVALTDATGQVSINQADERQLARYFEASGIAGSTARRLADEVLDWRDDDNIRRELGAEREAYLARGVTARNGAFESIEELRMLPSMTRGIYDRIRAEITLSGDKKLHAGSASRAALMSLQGMTGEFADAIIAARGTGTLTDEWIAKSLPIGASELKDRLRAKPSNVVRILVESLGDTAARFEGLAVIGKEGIEAMTLRPV